MGLHVGTAAVKAKFKVGLVRDMETTNIEVEKHPHIMGKFMSVGCKNSFPNQISLCTYWAGARVAVLEAVKVFG